MLFKYPTATLLMHQPYDPELGDQRPHYRTIVHPKGRSLGIKEKLGLKCATQEVGLWKSLQCLGT